MRGKGVYICGTVVLDIKSAAVINPIAKTCPIIPIVFNSIDRRPSRLSHCPVSHINVSGTAPDLSRFHSVLVNNLAEGTTPEDLNELFKTYGEVGDVYVPKDRSSHSGYKNFGFVRFLSKDTADAALEADGSELHGNKIGVQEAKYGRRDRERGGGGGGGYGRDFNEDRDYDRGHDRGYDRAGRGGYDDRRGGGYYEERRGYRDYRRRSYSRSPPRHRSRSPPGRYRD